MPFFVFNEPITQSKAKIWGYRSTLIMSFQWRRGVFWSCGVPRFCPKFLSPRPPPLVGGCIPTPLKNMKVKWDDDIPKIWENKKCSKPPTSQVFHIPSTIWLFKLWKTVHIYRHFMMKCAYFRNGGVISPCEITRGYISLLRMSNSSRFIVRYPHSMVLKLLKLGS